MEVNIQEINERIQKESAFVDALRMEIGKVIIGQKGMVDRLLVGVLGDGHILLEGVPGLAKTTAIKTLAAAMKASFHRIQFTPDLLPADLIGTMIYNQKNGEFQTKQGPVFANFILADEINRSPAKVQSALLEAMQERQVTIGEETFLLPRPFLVMATQNPIEQAGTYSLPEAQVDRFLMRTSLGYPDHAATMRILEPARPARVTVPAIAELDAVTTMAALTHDVQQHPLVSDYIARIVAATRDATQVRLGASMRGALGLARACRAWALAHGRYYVIPDDVKALAEVVLAHRLILDPEAEFDGVTQGAVIGQILLDIAPPSQRDLA